MKKERISNIELLRVLAMFLVLVVHSDYFSLCMPSALEVTNSPIPSFTRIFIEQASVICVNVFILISGYFGIKYNRIKFTGFLFQCFFFLFGIYCIMLLFGKAHIDRHGIAGCLLFLKWNWFIKSYIILYLFSPVLNSFIQTTSNRTMCIVLCSFYAISSSYGLSGAAPDFNNGYSALSFFGLYLIGAYIRQNKERFRIISSLKYALIYIGITIFIPIALIGIVFMKDPCHLYEIMGDFSYSYINPINIISSIAFFMIFEQMRFKSKAINFLGASSFSVFLIHTNPNITIPYFKPLIQHLYNSNNGFVTCLVIFVILIAIYATAIIIDQLRLFLWKQIEVMIKNHIQRKPSSVQ